MAALIGRCSRSNITISKLLGWKQWTTNRYNATTETLTDSAMMERSTVADWKPPQTESTTTNDKQDNPTTAPAEYRFIFPEFLPEINQYNRNSLREKLERADMLNRRKVLLIPEFYVGTVMAVTVSDRFSPGKINRFVGICIHRGGAGLKAVFTLRNVVNHQGVEIMYDMYNPTIRDFQVLRLEKRLDDELFYLRDAAPEFSTFPFDMLPESRVEGSEVHVNPLKVTLNPPPWNRRWELQDLKGVNPYKLSARKLKRAAKSATPWLKYDLMREYRKLIPEEEQAEIYSEVHEHKMEIDRRSHADKLSRSKLRTPVASSGPVGRRPR